MLAFWKILDEHPLPKNVCCVLSCNFYLYSAAAADFRVAFLGYLLLLHQDKASGPLVTIPENKC